MGPIDRRLIGRSEAERYICRLLNDWDINFDMEASFLSLTNQGRYRTRRRLYFDFILFLEGSRTLFIEYDGKAHFGLGRNEDPEKFVIQRFNDRKKDEYIIKNNLHLIRIPYTVCDNSNFENLLNDSINGVSILKAKLDFHVDIFRSGEFEGNIIYLDKDIYETTGYLYCLEGLSEEELGKIERDWIQMPAHIRERRLHYLRGPAVQERFFDRKIVSHISLRTDDQ